MKQKRLSLTHALSWIIVSTLLINGSAHFFLKHYQRVRYAKAHDQKYAIRTLIQTGPQREMLKTDYLAELIGIGADHPPSSIFFDLSAAKQKLLESPLIAHADVKIIKPNTLYIDYTVRQPIAWLLDYENTVIDKEGVAFPFSPFFSPKNLPEIYIGFTPEDSDRQPPSWNTPIVGKYIELALQILSIVTEPKVADLFNVKRIDVSNAYAESYGSREIVVTTEDHLNFYIGGKEGQYIFPRLLRLSTKHYAQEMGNYLNLRAQLLEEERKKLKPTPNEGTLVRKDEKILDFRIPQLAFIAEN